jgi:putative addiction module CopG family antidote
VGQTRLLGLWPACVDALSGLATFANSSTVHSMTTMNVSLLDDLKRFVEAQVSDGNYGSTSEYVRDLIFYAPDNERLDIWRVLHADERRTTSYYLTKIPLSDRYSWTGQ